MNIDGNKNISALTAILDETGQAYEVLPCSVSDPGDGAAVVTAFGGRVLGLFPDEEGENFFWTNPALDSVSGAKQLFGEPGWKNIGGDRSWIAPELYYFFPDYPNLEMETYEVPEQMDPGHFVVASEYSPAVLEAISKNRAEDTRDEVPASVTVDTEFTLRAFHTEEDIRFQLKKTVAPTADPLKNISDSKRPEVSYTGYALRSEFSFHAHAASNDRADALQAQAGLWNLVQLPHGGTLTVPVFRRTDIKKYFGDFSGEELSVGKRLISYTMNSTTSQKIGVSADVVTGRAGYIVEQNGGWSLVIRNFFSNPSGQYIDVAWNNPEDLKDFGYVFQACNFNAEGVAFSEMEYHLPAGKCVDSSQLWAFRGPYEEIRKTAELLLGM
jgi:hypothetical protein